MPQLLYICDGWRLRVGMMLGQTTHEGWIRTPWTAIYNTSTPRHSRPTRTPSVSGSDRGGKSRLCTEQTLHCLHHYLKHVATVTLDLLTYMRVNHFRDSFRGSIYVRVYTVIQYVLLSYFLKADKADNFLTPLKQSEINAQWSCVADGLSPTSQLVLSIFHTEPVLHHLYCRSLWCYQDRYECVEIYHWRRYYRLT